MSYQEYLKLDTLLACQQPKTAELDEMLFIITHQTCELWFKQILLEIEDLTHNHFFQADKKLQRVSLMLTQVTNQLAILETMSPSSFLKFRSELGCASGLQSVQFRYLEAILGLRSVDRSGCCPTYIEKYLTPEQLDNVAYFEEHSLFNKLDKWLSKLPQVANFISSDEITKNRRFSHRSQEMILHLFKNNDKNVNVLQDVLEIDNKLSLFRFRHIQLVQRMIGMKTGTGGSACGYLHKTLNTSIFGEISELLTLV